MKNLIATFILVMSATFVFGQATDIRRIRPLAEGPGMTITSDANGRWVQTYAASGIASDTTSATGYVTVPHAAKTSALSVFVTPYTIEPYIVTVSSVTDTTFVLRFATATNGAALNAVPVTFGWHAKK